ncbi:MAG: ribulose-phosphate 3-epimerase [Alphaproteobacteria bacterium]|nr:ribulose-phosphate 3-epimerase [Alphaproteobacteria bacterium]
MNLISSSFLCLDIGTYGVRGIAHHINNGHIDRSAYFTTDSSDTSFAIKSVIDELEHQLGTHFDSAYITGNFGPSKFNISVQNTVWGSEHKITISDIRNQISKINTPDNFFPLHIIPLRYDTPSSRNMLTPINHIDLQLLSTFSSIFYSQPGISKTHDLMRTAHIQPIAFFDPQYIQNNIYRQAKQPTMFIDFGAEYTSASIWTDRGPVWHTKIPLGGTNITNALCEKFNISPESATTIKHNVSSLLSKEMDRFTPADTAYDFSRGDINDIVMPLLIDIISTIKEQSLDALRKYKPTKIIISGGGAAIEGLRDFVENTFATITDILPSDATVRALSDYIWRCEASHRTKYIAHHDKLNRYSNFIKRLFNKKPKKKKRFIPIMPSTLSFDMRNPETYSLFKSGDISMIHVDIMDGFYVDRIAGSISELKMIRSQTNAHLHVHLMTESPTVWASDAIAAGADTIILSTNTSGLRNAIKTVRAAGRRVGIALHPDSPVSLLKTIIKDIDEVMIMSVPPGAAGQTFDPTATRKITALAATRKKYGLKFTISVDGGINDKTAALCWAAGADLLVSGSYLAKSHDFPLAVQSLLPNTDTKH